MLSVHIKTPIYQFFNDEISLETFEKWIYTTPELEIALGEELYFELISFNFRQKDAKHILQDLLHSSINFGECETIKLLHLLKEAKQRSPNLLNILVRFYHYSCNGYDFLTELGYGYGSDLLDDPELMNNWHTYNDEKRKETIAYFSNNLDNDLEKVIYWLENKKIILLNKTNNHGLCLYQDMRREDEKPEYYYHVYPSQTKSIWYEFISNEMLIQIIIIVAVFSTCAMILCNQANK